jgi:Holliday junction resolvasome RuvABC DNA-binding subunit
VLHGSSRTPSFNAIQNQFLAAAKIPLQMEFLAGTAPERTIAAAANGHTSATSLVDDAVSALINLGYKPAEAKRAVDSVDGLDDQDGLEILIRKSLAIILGEK